MTAGEFFARYRETEAALQAYVETLPLWVNVWRAWMFFVFSVGIVFVVHRVEARWLAVAMVAGLFGYNVVAMLHGVGRFPSIAFVVCWTPLAIYFTRRRGLRRGDRRFDRLFAVWLATATVTLWISLAFDVYNVLYAVFRGVA